MGGNQYARPSSPQQRQQQNLGSCPPAGLGLSPGVQAQVCMGGKGLPCVRPATMGSAAWSVLPRKGC
jgi:hypothetical protein